MKLDDIYVNIPKTVRECKKSLRFAEIHKLPKTFSEGIDRLQKYLNSKDKEKNNGKES
jgi:hypothetical protein